MADEGINHLARVLHSRTQEHRNAYSDLILDFGEIQGDHSLLTNTFPVPIPKSDYLVLKHLVQDGGSTLTTSSGGDHQHQESEGGWTKGAGGHSHTVTLPAGNSLQVGDRVLVAWVQHDAVVVGVIMPAASAL